MQDLNDIQYTIVIPKFVIVISHKFDLSAHASSLVYHQR